MQGPVSPQIGASRFEVLAYRVPELLCGEEAGIEHLVLELRVQPVGRGLDRDSAGLGLVLDLGPHHDQMAPNAATLGVGNERKPGAYNYLVPLAQLVRQLLHAEQVLVQREEWHAGPVLSVPRPPFVEVDRVGAEDCVRLVFALIGVAKLGLGRHVDIVREPAPEGLGDPRARRDPWPLKRDPLAVRDPARMGDAVASRQLRDIGEPDDVLVVRDITGDRGPHLDQATQELDQVPGSAG